MSIRMIFCSKMNQGAIFLLSLCVSSLIALVEAKNMAALENSSNTCKLSFINNQQVIREIKSGGEGDYIVIGDDDAISDFDEIIQEDDNDGASPGTRAFSFIRGLAHSETFREQFWHKNPLLIRSDYTGGWIPGAYTIERDLKSIEGSYITGHKTAEVLRNGTNTSTWAFKGLKEDLARKNGMSNSGHKSRCD